MNKVYLVQIMYGDYYIPKTKTLLATVNKSTARDYMKKYNLLYNKVDLLLNKLWSDGVCPEWVENRIGQLDTEYGKAFITKHDLK